MANTMSDWIKVFSYCEIPVLRQSKLKLQSFQVNEQDITVTVLADIARQDPGFEMSLLRHASKSKKREITTLSHAISFLARMRSGTEHKRWHPQLSFHQHNCLTLILLQSYY